MDLGAGGRAEAPLSWKRWSRRDDDRSSTDASPGSRCLPASRPLPVRAARRNLSFYAQLREPEEEEGGAGDCQQRRVTALDARASLVAEGADDDPKVAAAKGDAQSPPHTPCPPPEHSPSPAVELYACIYAC
ncbi:unnamed protein product [Lampetra fluviatilis]